jgi:hypothetical protein
MTHAAMQDFRLPDLRFLPVGSLVPHERHDPQRLGPLVERLRGEAVLHNPPVVTPLAAIHPDDPRYVVLDGANRASALAAAGFPHVVAQVVRYEEPDVRLLTWHHALAEFAPREFQGACARVPGLECRTESLLHARAMLARREVLAYACGSEGGVTAFHGGGDLRERNEMLNAIVDLYRETRAFYRTTTESFEVARIRHPEVTALVVFPHFDPAEVLELATSGSLLPAGITRHLVQWRALRVNIPIERLGDRSAPIEEKNEWLQRWLLEKLERRQARFYEESTVLFDE